MSCGVKIGTATDAALNQIMALYEYFNLEISIGCILQDYSNVGIETSFCFSGSVKSVIDHILENPPRYQIKQT